MGGYHDGGKYTTLGQKKMTDVTLFEYRIIGDIVFKLFLLSVLLSVLFIFLL